MHALIRDLRFALRMLAKSPGYTFVAVLTLAFAIGANTAIFSTVNALLLRPLAYEDPDELLLVMETQPKFARLSVAYPNYVDYRDKNATLDGLAAYRRDSMNLTGKGKPERLAVAMYSHAMLPTLGVEPALGRNFVPEEDAARGPKAVLLTHGFWTRRFAADPALVGRSITLDGGEWTVVGVLPPDFRLLDACDIVVPLGVKSEEPNFRSRGSHPGIVLVGRLKDDVTLEQAKADMVAVGDGIAVESPDNYGDTRPLLLPMHEELASDYREGLLLLMGAVVCVLLIAIANVANLMLARAMTRQKEMRVRAALGAGRWRLVRQLLVESVLLATIGGALGLLLAVWGVDLLASARPDAIDALGPIEIDVRVLAYTVAVALATGVLFGLVPAFYMSRQDLSQALKDADQRTTAGGRHLRARNLLVVAEVGLALMLLVGATLAMRSLARIQEVDPGFEPANVLTVEVALPPGRYKSSAEIRQFWTELERRVAALPEVESVSVSAGLPFAGAAESSFLMVGEARGVDNVKMAVAYFVDANYIETMKIPLLAGRTFGPQDRSDTPTGLLIDKDLADRFFPGQDPVGQHLQDGMSDKPSVEIVGVVGHVRHYGPDAPQTSLYQIYYAYPQLPEDAQRQVASNMSLVLRTRGEPHGLTAQVREAVAAIDPEQPIFAVMTMDEHIARTLTQRRFTISLLGVFAGLAMVLAAVGLYAVMAHSVQQRTHELGVRLSLGAQPRALVALVVRQGMTLVGLGVVLGLLGAFALSRVMESLLSDQISTTDPASYAGVTAILVLVGLTASWIPARRASRVDPMVAMRHE